MSARVVVKQPSFDLQAVREQFPTLRETINGKPLVYLDNGASVHKPQAVIDAVANFYSRDYSNIHRGVHTLSQRATSAYEAARGLVRRFINAPLQSECIFTAGTTQSMNLVAQTLGRQRLGAGDEVLVTAMEHHSGIVPWQLVCAEVGAKVIAVPLNAAGELEAGAVQALINSRTKIVSLVHVSNALGTVNPVSDIAALAHAAGAICVVDGAQAVPHGPVDVQALGCDFYAFSGHKMFGPTGVGVLWGRQSLLEAMPPWQGGGDMIKEVSFEGSTWADPPARFEAGTPNIAGGVGLGAAMTWMSGIDWQAAAAHERDLLSYGTQVLGAIDGLRLIGTADDKQGILSFVIEGLHPHDIGTILDMDGIAVRVGHHCAQPVMAYFGVSATVRASLCLYNTRADLDALVSAIAKAKDLLG